VIVAIATITVTAALAAALVAAASMSLQSTTRESSNKRALAAAQAGLSVATYRFTQVSASASGSFSTNCVTDREEAWKTTSPHCPVATGYFSANGASGSYYLTPDMSSALTGMSTVATACGYVSPGERCLTAIGTASGVTRRIQERLKIGELFPIHGMLGLKEVKVNSSPSWGGSNFGFSSDTGSNGAISFENNVEPPKAPYHCEIGPAGSAPGGCSVIKRPQTITVASVDTLPFGSTQTTNANATIAAGYTVATRSLTVKAGTKLELASGDYNLCFVTIEKGATLVATTGARVRIFVDSASRSGSGCVVATGGKVNAGSGVQINSGATQGQLELYLYGTVAPPASLASPPPATCNTDFTFINSAKVASANLYIYAPDSNVFIESEAKQEGAIVACKATYEAKTDKGQWYYPPSGIRPSSGGGPVTGTFRECTPTYSGDPESGCG
jgi:hypothetical protein